MGARRDERGSAALYVAIIMAGLLLMAGLVSDGASKMRTARTVTLAAAEAARAASQHLTGKAIQGQSAGVDTSAAAAAARTYLHQAGVAGTVSVSGTTVRITTSKAWSPRFFGIVPGSTLHGSATATAKRT